MRKFSIVLVASGLLWGFLAAAPPAQADVFDLRLGSFGSSWCDYTARFHIESKEANRWVFHGHVNIIETNEYDELWIEQYADNSLRMIRYLQGSHAGQTQTVQTGSPKLIHAINYIQFSGQSSYGYGCAGITALGMDV